VGTLLEAEAARFRALLDRAGVDPALVERLHHAAATVNAAHRAAQGAIVPSGGRDTE
jgi:hypothetical protein